jgi:hypothetical protein
MITSAPNVSVVGVLGLLERDSPARRPRSERPPAPLAGQRQAVGGADGPLAARRFDPLRAALRSLRAIYLDGGTRDEWDVDLGALAIRDALAELDVTDVACELFDAPHGGIDYR